MVAILVLAEHRRGRWPGRSAAINCKRLTVSGMRFYPEDVPGAQVSQLGRWYHGLRRRRGRERRPPCTRRAATQVSTSELLISTPAACEGHPGRAIQGHREELVIATQRLQPDRHRRQRARARRHITRAVEDSLKRLKTDRVEVLIRIKMDLSTPLEESLRALEETSHVPGRSSIRRQQSHPPGQQQAIDIEEAQGWAREVIQPMYNLVKRQAEVDLPMAEANGVAVAPTARRGRAPLGQVRAEGRARERPPAPTRCTRSGRRGVDARDGAAFAALCKQRGVHPMSMAVAWTGSHRAITAPIIARGTSISCGRRSTRSRSTYAGARARRSWRCRARPARHRPARGNEAEEIARRPGRAASAGAPRVGRCSAA